MKKAWALLTIPSLLLIMSGITACSTSTSPGNRSRISRWESRYHDANLGRVTPAQMLAEVGVQRDLIPSGHVGRYVFRPMKPKYITIHSTQNYTGNAYNHALALKRGALRATKRKGGNRIGFLTWHFTVQDNVAIQHLPCREQGEHADFDGPGNNYSIGIEMCEHHGNDIGLTIDKTARLTAVQLRHPVEPYRAALSLAAHQPQHQGPAQELPALSSGWRPPGRHLAVVPQSREHALQAAHSGPFTTSWLM
jgi:N-acetylmuramoyl-L-alanine amidase